MVSYFAFFREETDKTTASQRELNAELNKTQETLNRIGDVKTQAENIQFLNPRQKQKLKADAQREIQELEDIISQEKIAYEEYKQWVESEKANPMSQTPNAYTPKNYKWKEV